jgi:Arc/MetJ-type ribon-helix-helix transcriptional regulator
MSSRMVNVTATLSVEDLDKINQLIDSGKVNSRATLIRSAVENYFKDQEGAKKK